MSGEQRMKNWCDKKAQQWLNQSSGRCFCGWERVPYGRPGHGNDQPSGVNLSIILSHSLLLGRCRDLSRMLPDWHDHNPWPNTNVHGIAQHCESRCFVSDRITRVGAQFLFCCLLCLNVHRFNGNARRKPKPRPNFCRSRP